MSEAFNAEHAVDLSDIGFSTSALFSLLAAITVAILTGLYVWLW